MKSLLKALMVSLFVLFVFLIALPQTNVVHSIASSILVVYWTFPIFLIGVPTWRQSSQEFLNFLSPITIPLLYVVLPYILLIISHGTQLTTSLLDLILWYFLPTLLFLLPECIKGKIVSDTFTGISLFSYISAASLLWIGFDHRYTKTLFDGFLDMSYVLNAIWLASIVMVTFGLFKEIQNPENVLDRGLQPSWYATKIANITTPIASIIVIPFGLVTGFLIWNPQRLDLTIIIGIIGIFLTIALQEELIFRGVLQQELSNLAFVKSDQIRQYGVIVLVTVVFALTHWNNEVPEYLVHYFIAAFVAGLAYAISYKKAGLFSAMVAHTLVDWLWALFLKRV